MKKTILFFVFLFSLFSTGQTITYTADNSPMANPEKGFYYHTETHSNTAYSFLNQTSLVNRRVNQNITLILRVFYLENFRQSAISNTYLANMQTDFNTMRNAGVKAVVRFAYNDGDTSGNDDASKANILNHIQQLQQLLYNNRDVIASYQMGFIGRWGEGYYTNFFGSNGNLTAQNISDRNEVLTAIVQFFGAPSNRFIATRTPFFKQYLVGDAPLTAAEAYSGTVKSLIGGHNDAVLADEEDQGTFFTQAQYNYWTADNNYTVMGGETNTDSEFNDECSEALQRLNEHSFVYLNSGYHPTVLSNWQAQGCIGEIQSRLGYRLQLTSSVVSSGSIQINLVNTGFSHLYNERKVYIVYRNTASGVEHSYEIASDPRLWLKNQIINISHTLPTLPSGQYKVFLNMPDLLIPNNPVYSVRFANVGVWEASTGYNDLNQTVTIQDCSSTTTWNGSSWSNGTPNEDVNVVIAGNYSGNSFKCCNLTVDAVLDIQSFKYVSVVNDIVVNGTLTVQDSGSLIQVSNTGLVINNGTMNVIRNTTPMGQYHYTYWSSPMSNTTIGSALGSWIHNYTFSFETPNFYDVETTYNGNLISNSPDGQDDNGDTWQVVPQNQVMQAGKGYASMATMQNIPLTPFTVQFTGKVNNGVITVPLQMSGNNLTNNDDFNLVGNPYPSAIFSDNFINANPSFGGTIYFWTHKSNISPTNTGLEQLNFSASDYSMLNLTGGIRSVSDSDRPTRYIASCQGFLVKATQPNAVLLFDNSLRNEGYINEDFHRQSAEYNVQNEQGNFWIALRTQGLYSEQLIDYRFNTTADYDFRYDAETGDPNLWINFYSRINTDNYKIQSRGAFNENDVVPIGYVANIGGNYEISLEGKEGIMTNQKIYLRDLEVGTTHDLASPYRFFSDKGIYNMRFEILYKKGELSQYQLELNRVQITPNPAQEYFEINLENPNNYNIFVVDVIGRKIDVPNDGHKFDVRKLENSTYFLVIENKNAKKVIRFVKRI